MFSNSLIKFVNASYLVVNYFLIFEYDYLFSLAIYKHCFYDL